MALIGNINPNVKFIHHSKENARDPEAKKEERRRAASDAFRKTFGRECQWFDKEQEMAEGEEQVRPLTLFVCFLFVKKIIDLPGG